MEQPKAKHVIGVLTVGTLALVGVIIPHWEGITNQKKVNGERVSVAIHQSFDPKGVITVCHGHTNLDDPNLKTGDVYTAVMCTELLKQDIVKYQKQIVSCLPKAMLVTDKQHAAILSFEYNVGRGNFCNGSVGRLFREGRHNEACDAMGLYKRANGVTLKGLVNRRYDDFFGEIAWCKDEG